MVAEPEILEPPRPRRAPRQPKSDVAPKQSPAERRSLLPDIQGYVRSFNDFLAMTPAAEDRLSEIELERLTVTFDAYQASDPKIHKWVLGALKASPGVAFAVVCVGITLDRLARHNMLPFLRQHPPEPAAPAYEPVSQNGSGPVYGPEQYGTTRVGGMPG